MTAAKALNTVLQPFTKEDYYAFAGAEGDNPLIAYCYSFVVVVHASGIYVGFYGKSGSDSMLDIALNHPATGDYAQMICEGLNENSSINDFISAGFSGD